VRSPETGDSDTARRGDAELLSAAELFERSVATLIRSWVYLASGSPGAEVIETDGAAIATFVHPPDREFLNNAVLAAGAADLGATLEAVERAYASRGIDRYAIWAHESDEAGAQAIEARGYVLDSSTRTMAMQIAEPPRLHAQELDLVEPGLAEFWRSAEVDGFVPDLEAEGAHFYLARFGGENAATLMAFDHVGDCGIYMVGTAPAARRQGLATALSAHAVVAARARGCTTASLQATEMAEGVYAAVGFRDLGRFDEYVPA
jgi:ribosomal protein S18 acetylase RimI-like enzyme